MERSVVWMDGLYEKSGAEKCEKKFNEVYGRERGKSVVGSR